MYLTIGGTRYTVKKRLVSSNTIKYLGVTPEPPSVSGTINMYRNDGFLLSSDAVNNFERSLFSGTLLQLTNKPEIISEPFTPVPMPPTAKVVTAVVG